MLRIIDSGSDNILAIQASDKLTDADFVDVWLPTLKGKLDSGGKVRLLLYMDETFGGLDGKTGWHTAKLGLKELSRVEDVEKVAFVGGPKWVQEMTSIVSGLGVGEARSFATGSLSDAKAWVS